MTGTKQPYLEQLKFLLDPAELYSPADLVAILREKGILYSPSELRRAFILLTRHALGLGESEMKERDGIPVPAWSGETWLKNV